MGRAERILAIAAGALTIVGWSAAQAEPDRAQEGTIELAGGGHGCVKLDHRTYVIKYGDRHFHYPPSVDVTASADDDNISLTADTGAISRKAARIVVTATGPGGHQVCGPARVTWTLTSNDDG